MITGPEDTKKLDDLREGLSALEEARNRLAALREERGNLFARQRELKGVNGDEARAEWIAIKDTRLPEVQSELARLPGHIDALESEVWTRATELDRLLSELTIDEAAQEVRAAIATARGLVPKEPATTRPGVITLVGDVLPTDHLRK